MAADLIGRTIGRYRIVSRIGQGGMGVVFEAFDEKLHRRVALKLLGDDVARDADRRRRFLREARVAAGLSHPSIAAVYDAGETADGDIYIAMELVAGASLRERIARGPLDVADALAIAKDLARALVKAHEQGIVHRDLKPDNVMVNDALDVKVLDFGLAKAIQIESDAPKETASSIATKEGHLLGTPGYMSPEQADGRSVDARTDVFALGVVLYEMTTGARPFLGGSAMEIIIATTRDEPLRPSKLRAEVGPELERVILRCLEKNVDARHATARELASDLASIDVTTDRPTRSAAPSPSPAAPRKDVGNLPTQQSLVRSSHSVVGGRARSSAIAIAMAIGVAVVALAVGSRFMGSPSAPAPSSVRAATPAPTTTTLTDHPDPPSDDPRVVSEYRAGLQALRDDDWGIAQAHFTRVVELAPLLALGHLRLAMAAEGTLDEAIRRSHYATAVTLRGQLGARDQAMMEAIEPVLQRSREDRMEAVTRLRALLATYPLDVEIHVWLAFLQHDAAGLAPADRAIELDPRDGQAWQSRGDVLAGLGRTDESRAAYERCGAISPGSAECFLGLVWLDSMEGRCDDAERDARRAVDRDPHLASNLACVMAGAGRPNEAVRQVLDQATAAFAPMPFRWQDALDDARLAIRAGDFVRGRELAAQYQAVADADPHALFRDHLYPAILLIGLAQEAGDDAQAFRTAASFVSRSDTLSKSALGDAGIDASLRLARLALRKGGLSRSEFDARRATWIDAQKRSVAQPGLTWAYAYAATAETREEADAAFAALPAFAPLSSFAYYVGIPDAEIGSAYFLAGRVDEAVTHLDRAVANCAAFRHPFVHARAAMQLGQALEQKREPRRACDAYRDVVARWGNAKPRSISAERARARMSAIGCAP